MSDNTNTIKYYLYEVKYIRNKPVFEYGFTEFEGF